MRILYVAHRVPYPPDKGDKIRGWHFLARLARTNVVDLACLADDPKDLAPEWINALYAVCNRVEVIYRPRSMALMASARALWSGAAMSLPFFRDARLQSTVDRWIGERRYDAALAHSAPMAQYIPARNGLVRVADFCDVDSEKWRQYAGMTPPPKRWVYRREARKLRAWETEVARTWDSVVLATQPEAALFRGFCKEGRVEVVPNGVDADFFRPCGAPGETVLFTGAMDYFPNIEGVVWFAKEIWPLIRNERPRTRFVIVGPRPSDAVRALHDPEQGIEVRGRVRDVREAIAEAAVCVAPLRIARGIQNKVLEAMASTRPVVVTHAAFEGVTATPGRDLLVADEPAAFAGQVVDLLADPARRRRVGENARTAVLASHAWDAHAGALEKLLQVAPRNPGAGRTRAGEEAWESGANEKDWDTVPA